MELAPAGRMERAIILPEGVEGVDERAISLPAEVGVVDRIVSSLQFRSLLLLRVSVFVAVLILPKPKATPCDSAHLRDSGHSFLCSMDRALCLCCVSFCC